MALTAKRQPGKAIVLLPSYWKPLTRSRALQGGICPQEGLVSK